MSTMTVYFKSHRRLNYFQTGHRGLNGHRVACGAAVMELDSRREQGRVKGHHRALDEAVLETIMNGRPATVPLATVGFC
jgi:hypothetical protein